MAAIGWIDDITDADSYYAARFGASELWSNLTPDEKVAALTTAYNALLHSSELSIPSSPSATEKEILAYAQEEYALIFIVTGSGGIRRLAAQSQGVTEAGVVKETYGGKTGLPAEILGILEGFKANQCLFFTELYKDESVNDAYDAHFGI